MRSLAFNLGKAVGIAMIVFALMLPQVHGYTPEDVPAEDMMPCCLPEQTEVPAPQPEADQDHGCCSTQPEQPCEPAPQDEDPDQPCDDDCPPCDCPCCVKTLMIAPILPPMTSARAVFVNDSHLLALPATSRPDAVALGVAIQPPIA